MRTGGWERTTHDGEKHTVGWCLHKNKLWQCALSCDVTALFDCVSGGRKYLKIYKKCVGCVLYDEKGERPLNCARN